MGEIAHKGLIHAGDHQPIIERELFDAVQTQLQSGAVDRKLKHAGTPYLLKGRLFDSAGNCMTPSHSVKKGVRYRYYVSQAILGSRPEEVGRVGRVSAPELEALIEETLRKRFASAPGQSLGAPALVETHLERAVVQCDAIELSLTNSVGVATEIVRLDWQHKTLTAEKELTAERPPTYQDPKTKDAVLAAIGKARSWMKNLGDGATITDIAKLEGKGERQIRLLLPLWGSQNRHPRGPFSTPWKIAESFSQSKWRPNAACQLTDKSLSFLAPDPAQEWSPRFRNSCAEIGRFPAETGTWASQIWRGLSSGFMLVCPDELCNRATSRGISPRGGMHH